MVAFATQVKRRRGTEEQNDAFTGAEGEIVVDMTNMTLRVHDGRTRGGFVVGGGAGRNIGDIFFTTRTDTSLNGAVEANGGQYNTTDFAGSDSVGNMLSAGKVPYMTIADFDTAVANNGECTSFGWDGGTVFKVPKINGRRLIRRQLPTADNNYTWYNLYSDGWVEQGGIVDVGSDNASVTVTLPVRMDGTNDVTLATEYTASYSSEYDRGAVGMHLSDSTTAIIKHGRGSTKGTSWQVNGYAAESEYNDKSTWQYDRYMRPMVQLANGATDEAVVVAGNVLADISDIRQQIDALDVVIESQLPTADNGYTWYRKYKSGWVEQGGRVAIATSPGSAVMVTFPIEMADTEYQVLYTAGTDSRQWATNYVVNPQCIYSSRTTTGCGFVDNLPNNNNACWQVSGMAAQ